MPEYKVYKLNISYFSGKLEAYLRYKEIHYESIECGLKEFNYVALHTGIQKVPAIEMADGRWLFDTTPTIQWLDGTHPTAPVYPEDPALRFLMLLIEDYGDEWLWRPSMWWRWVPKVSSLALGRRVAQVYPRIFAMPITFYFGYRQRNEWLFNDGVDDSNEMTVCDMLYRELEFLEPLFEQQPFIMGSHPSIADYGYFGSFFRHFGNDPDSAEVLRRQGSNTYEWLARLWNTRHSKLASTVDWPWPTGDFWHPLFRRIVADYLPYLHQNALAFQKGQKRFDYKGETLSFKGTITTNYRVWCRQELQNAFTALNPSDQQRLISLFEPFGGLDILHRDGVIASGQADQFKMPFDPALVDVKPSLLTRIFGQPRN